MATPISKVTLTIDNRDYVIGLQQASNQTKSFANEAASAFNKADIASNKLNLSAANLTGGLVKLRGTLATIGLGAFAASALQGADAVADLADSTQISIGKILEFQKALQLAGGDANDTGKALGAFYASIDEANQGSDKAQEVFRKLGVSLKDLKTLSEEDLLDKTIKGFRNITDPIQRNTVLVGLFGKAMRTVDPTRLGDELENLRGTLAAQEGSVTAAADAIEEFEKLVGALKGAVVLAIKPFLEFFGGMKDNEYNVRALAGTIQSLAAAYVALRVAAFGAAIATAAAGGGLKGGVAGLATGVAAAALTYKGIQELMDQIGAGPQPGTQGPAAALGANATMDQARAEERRIREGRNRDTDRRNREQQIGKELQGQLDAVNGLTEGYRRAAQANMDRYTQEVDILGRTEYEQELIKGTAEIEKKYADQLAALEEKRKNAKGQTLALIEKSISEVKDLQTSEQDIFEITRQQIFNYKQQQEEIKRVTEQIDKQIERQQTLADIIRGANDQVREAQNAPTLRQTSGLSELEKQILNIQQSTKKAALEAARTFAGAFEDGGDGLTVEKAEELAAGLDRIAIAYKRIAETQIEVAAANSEFSKTFEYGWNEAFRKYEEDAFNAADQAKTYFETFTRGFEDAIVRFVQTGKLSFKDLANTIIAEFARIQAKKIAIGVFGGSSSGGLLGSLLPSVFGNKFTPGSSSFVGPMQPGSGGGFLGNLFNSAKSFLGFANGGQPPVGMASMVGERGPELFIPRSAGTIIPNSMLGAQSAPAPITQVNYNIQAVDAASFRSLVARDPQFLFQVTEKGRRSQPTRSRA